MNKIKWLVICSCIVLIFSGCKAHKLDGPGMVYIPAWSEFTVSRSDEKEQNTFWFTVSEGDEYPLFCGECTDEEGNHYSETGWQQLPDEKFVAFRALNLEQLANAKKDENTVEKTLYLSVTLTSGETVEKVVTEEVAMKVYEILLPCFAEK